MEHGILFDHARTARIGLPEAVFCEGKPFEALVELLSRFGRGSGHPVLFTRLAPDVFARVSAEIRAGYDYHPLSHTAFGDALDVYKRQELATPRGIHGQVGPAAELLQAFLHGVALAVGCAVVAEVQEHRIPCLLYTSRCV